MPSIWNGGFSFQFEQTYIETLYIGIGPGTTDRVLADVVGPYVYLAPNGNDANSGATPALSKLTLASAITALGTLGRTTIHIIRNGYVGTITFALTGVQTIPVNKKIQVELGETATLDANGAGQLQLSGTGRVNGLYIQRLIEDLGAVVWLTAGTAKMEWCYVNVLGVNSTAVRVQNPTNPCILKSFIRGGKCVHLEGTSANAGIQNTILLSRNDLQTADTLASGVKTAGVIIMNGSPNVTGINLTNVIIANAGWALFDEQDITRTWTFVANCAVVQSDYVIHDEGGASAASTFNISYSFIPIRIATVDQAGTANVLIVSQTNMLNPATVALWTNLKAGLAGDPTGWIHQKRGRVVGTGKQLLTSPLVGAGLLVHSVADIGAWEDDVTPAGFGFSDQLEIRWPYAGLKKTTRFTNTATLMNIRGNPRSVYDTRRRVFEFTFGGGDQYANNNDLRRLIQLYSDTGVMQFYERGILKNLFVNPKTGAADATDGVWSNSGRLFSPNLGGNPEMIQHNWVGYWIVLVIAGTPTDFYIEANDDTSFTLLAKPSLQPGSFTPNAYPIDGTYDFTIEYIAVRVDLSDLEANTDRFTAFLEGSANREVEDTDTLKFELAGITVRFIEDEDWSVI